VTDAIVGTPVETHPAGLERLIKSEGRPMSWVALAHEPQRDWTRTQTVEGLRQIVLTDRLLRG
jgi:hypothetical protein